MFLKYIGTTPLTNNDADAFFEGKIFGDNIYGDTTFVASMRAMLADRLAEGETLRFFFNTTSYNASDCREDNAGAVIRLMKAKSNNSIKLHCLDGNKEGNDAWFDFFKEHLPKQYPGWVEVPRVEAFFKKVIDITCFVNVEQRATTLVVKNMDRRKMHYIQCGIPVFFPWFFTDTAKVTEVDLELVKSLQMKTEKRYLEILSDIAQKYDFAKAKIRRLLSGFETKFEKEKLVDLQYKSEETMNEIRRLQERMNEYLRQRTQYEDMIFGIETKINNAEEAGESEVMQYFLSNRALRLESVDGSRVKFSVNTYLEFYDQDMAEKMVDNKRSYIYAYVDSDQSADIEKLVRAIFIDEKLRIKTCAAYSVTSGGGVSPLTEFDFDKDVYGECMPNTHIDRYGCLGNHTRIINELLSKYDYVGAIDQCISSAKSLNFGDTTVGREFFKWLFGCGESRINVKCIELPDGSVVGYKDAIEYLNKEEE